MFRSADFGGKLITGFFCHVHHNKPDHQGKTRQQWNLRCGLDEGQGTQKATSEEEAKYTSPNWSCRKKSFVFFFGSIYDPCPRSYLSTPWSSLNVCSPYASFEWCHGPTSAAVYYRIFLLKGERYSSDFKKLDFESFIKVWYNSVDVFSWPPLTLQENNSYESTTVCLWNSVRIFEISHDTDMLFSTSSSLVRRFCVLCMM